MRDTVLNVTPFRRPPFGRKITPGPYRATKLWREFAEYFRQGITRRRHWRHIKFHNDCFTACEAVNFLHHFLQQNPNTGSDVTRSQTIKLLQKFLESHIIEDVNGKWMDGNFSDDNHLYRLGPQPEKSSPSFERAKLDARSCKESIKVDVKETKRIKKEKVEKTKRRKENENKLGRHRSYKASSGALNNHQNLPPDATKRPLPPLPQCRVTQKIVTSSQVNDVWREAIIENFKRIFCVNQLDDLVLFEDIKGDWIKHNVTMVGRSGVVRVPNKEDLPLWTLSAMTCLARWPENRGAGLPTYPGFEKDIFKAICEFYCGSSATTRPSSWQEPSGEQHTYAEVDKSATSSGEPLLTFNLCEIFTTVLSLSLPSSENVAIEALQYSLLLLPPSNRRRLHLLLRFMHKVSLNPHLGELDPNTPTRDLLIEVFAPRILAFREEVYLDELLAFRLTSFLLEHHNQVMQAPQTFQGSIEKKLERMKRPLIRYTDGDEKGSFVTYSGESDIPLLAMSLIRCRLPNKEEFHGSVGEESDPIIKDFEEKRIRMLHFNDTEQVTNPKQLRRRSGSISKFFISKISSSKERIKATQSCPDISGMDHSTPLLASLAANNDKARAPSRNLRALLSKLRRKRS